MGLETSKRAILTQSVAMQTLGHNIANAATEGYSRQRVNVTATRPIEAPGMTKSTAPGQIGTGVQYDSITRIRDSYLDLQYRRENQSLASYDIISSTLSSIEGIINEPSETGLSSVMNKFWDSLEVLNRDPRLLSARINVVGAAVNFTDTLQHIGKTLQDLGSDIDNNITAKVGEANVLIQGIAQLNDFIRHVEATGDNANDYRDQRDLLVDKLSTIVDVQVTETPDGGYSVTSAGVQVVSNGTATELTADAAENATAGQLHGYQASKDEVAHVQNQMNAMVSTLVTGEAKVTLSNGYVTSSAITAENDVTLENGTLIPAGSTIPAGSRIASEAIIKVNGFNGLHALGYTLTDPMQTGVPFFVTSDGSSTFDIMNIRVNPDIQNDTNLIAASGKYETVGTTNQTIKGNSDIAIALARLRDNVFTYPSGMTNLSSGTTDDYFRAVTSELGDRSANAQRNLNNQQQLVDSVNIRRQSVSGVSLDEEMADMIKFQHAYNAAARNMTVVDEMLDRIINGMGTVGR
ncbi:flagellar hook-associated protein FlgK [Cohnella caldifontis]|uniref:flagellar hook-associated protein FlgK n=1 Tax=Cohnella caldifontis TaxID=3027471 RepID=UPI0023EC4D26|nr:flagellar hook-associated protein FlgK [Cohnella sp. YIM B05605]